MLINKISCDMVSCKGNRLNKFDKLNRNVTNNFKPEFNKPNSDSFRKMLQKYAKKISDIMIKLLDTF